MRLKRLHQLGLLLSCLALGTANADNPLGQTVQINTHFRVVYGKPTWLLILRDVESGRVSPYIFDIKDNTNFWIALSYAHSYQVTASTLSFGPFATIYNYCGLEDGILTGQSLFVTVSGELSPIRSNSNCRVMKYNNLPFPIATPTNQQ